MGDNILAGFNPVTDSVEPGVHFTSDSVDFVRVTRFVPMRDHSPERRLQVVMPHLALADPWLQEFLWRHRLALGVVDVWWSLYRHPLNPHVELESLFQTADGFHTSQVVPRELVSDERAWAAARPYLFRGFLWQYQEAIDDGVVEVCALMGRSRLPGFSVEPHAEGTRPPM